jgi:hypothetical protein
MATTDGIEVLSNGIGYGIVVGIGAFFALLMSISLPSLFPPLTNFLGSQ